MPSFSDVGAAILENVDTGQMGGHLTGFTSHLGGKITDSNYVIYCKTVHFSV